MGVQVLMVVVMKMPVLKAVMFYYVNGYREDGEGRADDDDVGGVLLW